MMLSTWSLHSASASPWPRWTMNSQTPRVRKTSNSLAPIGLADLDAPLLPPPLVCRIRRDRGGGRRVRHPHGLRALLRRPGVRSFRRHAVLRPLLATAEERHDAVSLVHEPREGTVAGSRAEPASGYAAQTCRWCRMAPLLCRPCELAAADRRPQHPDRSGLGRGR